MNLFSLLFVLFIAIPTAAFAGTATLTWTANPEGDVVGYNIYRGLTACSASTTVLAPLDHVGKVTTFVDKNVPPFDGELCYEITAIDIAGQESARSNRAKKLVNLLPPSAPSNLAITTVTP